ncbi:MAG: hypothetical protein ABII06_20810 [Pseudomonadota bacterium]
MLVVDKGKNISAQITAQLRPHAIFALCVEEFEDFYPLLDSRDRVYTVVYVDQNHSPEVLKEHIRCINTLEPGIPVVFTTMNSDASKERAVRKAGVFFYHVRGDGMKMLGEAVLRGMEYAVRKEIFIGGFDVQ